MTLQDCFDKVTERVKYFSCATRDIEPSSIAFTELSEPTRLCQAPLVSVLMRAYNAEATIGRAIESIVTQETDFPFELIIADDASTDGTVAVCQEWLTKHPDKIRILRACKNSGNSVNDVLTHSQARGKWIAECDSDDYWLETCKLQRQMDLIRKHNAVLCVTEYLVRDVRDNRLYMFPLPKTEVVPPRELARAYFQLGSLLYSKAAYEQMVREIPLDFQSDVRKANCLARYGKVVCLHDVASVWVVGGGTYSSRAETTKSLIVMLTHLALFRYGPWAARKVQGILMLEALHRALHPKTGLSAQEWREIRPFVLPPIGHVVRRVQPSLRAFSLTLKIRSRARRLRNAD